jgi:RNA polymerase sigma-70 factor (ECF subfamily)
MKRAASRMGAWPVGGPPMEKDAATLVERARTGDREALEALVVAHLPALRAFVRVQAGRGLRELESCSDLVQSACREALQDLSGFEYRDEAAFRCWLYRAAERKVLDRARFHGRARRDVRREQAPIAGNSGLLDCYATFCTPSQEAIAREEEARIELAMDELPPSYREVLRLRHVVGLSNKELAQELGHSPEYARMLLARARHKLTLLLDGGEAGST